MGPRALKVLSMCLWSCWKRSSLQNFSRLTQPFLPVWGISSKLRTRPSTPPFLAPALSAPFPPSNFPSTTVPAAVTQRALCGVTPQSRFLDPRAPCALIHTVTRMHMLLMIHWSHPEFWLPSSSSLQAWLFPSSIPNLISLNVLYPSDDLIADEDLWMWGSKFKRITTESKLKVDVKHTPGKGQKKSESSWSKTCLLQVFVTANKLSIY